MSMSLTHLRSVSGGLHLSRFGQLANSPSPSNPHLLTYATPSSWIQQYHLVHTVRPHSIASYQYVAPHPAFQPAAAAAAAVSHPSLVEHQQEGQPSRTFFSPSPKRVRLEGEPMDEADLHPASARSRRRSNFLVTLFSSRYERGRNIFGRLFGTLTCMVALAPGGDDTGAVHAAAASAAAESAEGQPSFTHPNAAPHSSAKPASGPSPPPYSFPFDNLKRFIPDLGKLEPVRPAVEFGLAAMVGYLSGCGVRTLTRVGLFIGGVGGLALYCLHREGIISFNFDKMRQLGAECYERGQNEVKKRIESNPELWQSGAQLIETLTTTSLGIGFTAGFVMAFGQ